MKYEGGVETSQYYKKKYFESKVSSTNITDVH